MNLCKKFLLFMGILCICNASENPPIRRRELTPRNNRSSHPAQIPVNEMVSQIQERISALSTMDQMHLNKLDSIENKLSQLDETAVSRLEYIRLQQQQLATQLSNLENMQHSVESSVGAIRNDIDDLRNGQEQPSHVHTRQANFGPSSSVNETESVSQKLESLAFWLTSIRLSASSIENSLKDFNKTLSRLTHLTRGTHKRLTTLSGRSQSHSLGAAHPQVYNTYGPPPPPASPAQYPTAPSNCAHALLPQTGIQKIQIDPQSDAFYALCESDKQGGWTIIQNRFDGSINFNRGWEEYKIGFGNLAGEFFIGMEKLHALTASTLHELMIVLTDFKNITRTARYNSFAITGEPEFYSLHILGAYSGDAGDSFSFQAGNKFSTFDNDNDGWVEGNCAQAHTGAWWYAACDKSNLNGQYLRGDVDPSQEFQGMYWNDFGGTLYSLRSVQMKIRPIDQNAD